jgi:hypothetical protein
MTLVLMLNGVLPPQACSYKMAVASSNASGNEKTPTTRVIASPPVLGGIINSGFSKYDIAAEKFRRNKVHTDISRTD